MQKPTPENQAIARYLTEVFLPDPRDIRRYSDNKDESSLPILKASNSPQKGVMSYATIGLSDYENKFETGADIRVEIFGAARMEFKEFGNAISTVAFFVINSGWIAYPGKVFPDVLKMYDLSPTMKHLLLVPPPLMWSENLEPLELDTKTVQWLAAIPISDSEYKYVEKCGDDELGSLLEEHQADVFDLDRDPVV